jgi:hypothetical protein
MYFLCCNKSYTTIERVLPFDVETLRNFKSILLGADIHVNTYDCNLIYNTPT